MATKVQLRKQTRKNITKVFLITRKHFLFSCKKKRHSCRNRWKFVEKMWFRRSPPPRKKILKIVQKYCFKKPSTEDSNRNGGGWGMTRCINACVAFAFPCLWAVIPYSGQVRTCGIAEHGHVTATALLYIFVIQDWVFKNIFMVCYGFFLSVKTGINVVQGSKRFDSTRKSSIQSEKVQFNSIVNQNSMWLFGLGRSSEGVAPRVLSPSCFAGLSGTVGDAARQLLQRLAAWNWSPP